MIDQDTLEKLKAEHGPVYVIPFEDRYTGEKAAVAIRRPSKGEYKRFRAMGLDENQRQQATETLARAVIVFPDAADVQRLDDEYPAFLDKVGNEAYRIAGGGQQVEAKKA